MNARDVAIAELAETLKIDRVAAAGVVDALVLAAAHEAGYRVNDAADRAA